MTCVAGTLTIVRFILRFTRPVTIAAVFLIAAAALVTLPRGMNGELRQLLFCYVGAGKRGQGWGRRLFQYALHQLPEMGASGLYISSIPNKNTVDFYLAQGCRLADKPDPALFALEPEDIHLVCDRL